MILTLVRHGQTHSNVRRLIDTGAPGAELTELGHQQAAALVPAFADREVDAIFVSRLIRTHQTAAPLAAERGIGPVELPGVHEITGGEYEMVESLAAVEGYLAALRAWSQVGPHVAIPGGEDGVSFFARFDADVMRAATESAHPVIVSHGAAIQVWAAERARNIDHSFSRTRGLGNTGVVMLEGDPEDGWRLLSWQGETVGPGGVPSRA